MSVLNTTLYNDMIENETLWRANTWIKQVLNTATSDRAEVSYTAVSNGVLCAACVFIFYMQIVSICCLEENRVNDCVKFCECGWGY
jgi:hypothetical protein